MKFSNNKTARSQKGISLIEILLALTILGVIGFYFTEIISLVDQGDKNDRCITRMYEISDQVKNFYKGRQTLPEPLPNPVIDSVLATAGEVPVQQLNLAQKYRLDPWGQYFLYARPIKQDALDREITDIIGYKVDGRDAAGVLISLGPNQKVDYEFDGSEFTTLGDDLLLPVTLENEAFEIALEALDVLNKRVSAYDRHFAGINNNPDKSLLDPERIPEPPEAPPECPDIECEVDDPGIPDPLVDEDGCVPAVADEGELCIPIPPVNFLTNDPNCGRASIDACEDVSVALNRMMNIYGLGSNYTIDPWGNYYQWGNSEAIETNDRRYHVFYSMGPDGETDTADEGEEGDDITSY